MEKKKFTTQVRKKPFLSWCQDFEIEKLFHLTGLSHNFELNLDEPAPVGL
jgi:hypothetical protein